MLTRITREWSLTPPPEWEAALAQHTPHTERQSHLRVHWHPGFAAAGKPQSEAEVVERFVIYQMMPPEFTSPMFLADHTARPLPNGGTRPRHELAWGMLGTAQKQLYRETGWYAQPLLCLQGTRGGEVWRYMQAEAMLAQMRDLPDTPVPPGDLPACPLDRRTFDTLDTRAEFLNWEFNRYLAERTGVDLEAEDAEAMRAARGQFFDWTEARMRGALDEYAASTVTRAAHGLIDSVPRLLTTREDRLAAAAYIPDRDMQREQFIHDRQD